ncbi:hypothetical protein ASC77_00230 [Nocardioides sp. Root1257]|uniref:DUF4386 domain-containing protein n=1 Tax=unclassified Nocardioides TaxID=2615069 RepID=UPI0006F23488|nr:MULTISPECIES: DUF4386 domain-containing protein [unclassified Nocardioides]KQW52786.1 hypothetical protein ASC77_00230 [Nocardioides sp. Root1257]KRC55474.1 hypothetical protein ASE24_00230 [Nocardioides sp. Root224]
MNARRTALLGGLAYLATFVFSMPAVPLLHPATDDPTGFVQGAGNETQVLVGGVFELITALACVATALALYPVTRRVSRTSALGFVASRTVEAGLILVGVVSILSVVTLRQDFAGTADAPAGLAAVAHGLVDVRDWTFLFGPGVMPAFNALFLATILYRAGLVPRVLPVLGLIGAPILLAKTMVVTFGGLDDFSVVAGLCALPIAAWELGLGLWLTFKGFRASPVLAA